MSLVHWIESRGRCRVGAAPDLDLLLPVLVGCLLLVHPLQCAVVTLVEPPAATDGKPHPVGNIEHDPECPDRTAQAGRVGRVGLETRSEEFNRCLTTKLFEYALGRPLGSNEMGAVETVLKSAKAQNYELRALILGVASHPLFIE